MHSGDGKSWDLRHVPTAARREVISSLPYSLASARGGGMRSPFESSAGGEEVPDGPARPPAAPCAPLESSAPAGADAPAAAAPGASRKPAQHAGAPLPARLPAKLRPWSADGAPAGLGGLPSLPVDPDLWDAAVDPLAMWRVLAPFAPRMLRGDLLAGIHTSAAATQAAAASMGPAPAAASSSGAGQQLQHSMQTFPAAIMVADVKGFTALTEALSASGGVAGVEQLMRCLNSYFSQVGRASGECWVKELLLSKRRNS